MIDCDQGFWATALVFVALSMTTSGRMDIIRSPAKDDQLE